MPNARVVTPLPQGAEASPIADDLSQWIEIMPTVERDRNGPWYWTITRDDLETWAADIASKPGEIPVDYDHAESGVGTKAAGWFTGETDIRKDDDGSHRLWAKVRWTSVAADEIRDGAWKRISPEMTFADKDPKTGLLTNALRIIAATLTNRPHFKQLAPVASEVVWEPGEGLQDLLSRVYDALNPGGYDSAAFWVMDVTSTKALVGEYDGQRTWVVPFTVSETGEIDTASRADWTPAEQEWVEVASAALKTTRAMRPFTEGAKMDEKLKAIATELGLGDDATAEQVVEAVKAAKAKADSAPEPTAPEGSVVLTSEQVTELQANAAAGVKAERELKGIRVRGMLEQAVRDGKILPVQAQAAEDGTPASLETWGLQDEDALKAHLEATPKHSYSLNARGSGEGGGEGGDDGDELAQAREDLTVKTADGEVAPDEESLKLHVAAEKILTEAGKVVYTEDEYRAAATKAAKSL